MSARPLLMTMDLEGVFTPEVWIAVSQTTGVEELRLTTRDIPDYDVLMRKRLGLLHEHGIKLRDIQDVIAGMPLLPGAREFLDRLRSKYETVILSDTYYEFAAPFMEKLGWPTLLCNSLEVDADSNVVDYHLRIRDGKRHAALAFKMLNFTIVGLGDSYNDTTMLLEADLGILFRPSDLVKRDFPQLPVAEDYETVERLVAEFATQKGICTG